MKKKLLALLIGTMVLGTLLGGCKQAEKTVETKEVVSEEESMEETKVEVSEEPAEIDVEFELVSGDLDYGQFNVYNEDSLIFEYAGTEETGYMLYPIHTYPIGYRHDDVYAYKISKGTAQDMFDYLRTEIPKELDEDDGETFEEVEGDGYVEHIIVQPEQGSSGETIRYRYYPYGDYVQVIEYHYANEDEALYFERESKVTHLHSKEELRDYYNDLVSEYPNERVEWIENTEKIEEHWEQ